jgi:hypothetical protein
MENIDIVSQKNVKLFNFKGDAYRLSLTITSIKSFEVHVVLLDGRQTPTVINKAFILRQCLEVVKEGNIYILQVEQNL